MFRKTAEATQVPMERQEPARAASFVADVGVPLTQAAITGAVVSGLVVFLVSELAPGFDADLVKVWFGLALAISAFAWLVLLMDTRRLLWAVERVLGADLDGDRHLGKPKERVVVLNAGRGQGAAAGREDVSRLRGFASFVARLPHKGTQLRSWEKELGRDVYQMYRDSLLDAGFARWRSDDERQGWELSVPVREILSRLAE